MILHALHDLYDRLEKDDAYDVAPEGYSLQKISFVIVLEPDGTLHQITDHRSGEGNKKRPQSHRVPGSAKPSGSGLNPCMLWDNTSYLLGYRKPDSDPQKAEKERLRALDAFKKSKEHHLGLEERINHPAFSAACRFLESWNPDRLKNVAEYESLARELPTLKDQLKYEALSDQKRAGIETKIIALEGRLPELRETCGEDLSRLVGIAEITTGFGIFKIRDDLHYLHEESAIDSWWKNRIASVPDSATTGTCLITGESNTPIADLHAPKIKGVKDAQGAGALIVSFNTNAYESFGKDSGFNAPVSQNAAAKYCKSLNALLTSNRHRLQIGDATTVFWTETPTKTESILSGLFTGELPEDKEENTSSQATNLLASLHNTLRSLGRGGKPDPEIQNDLDVPFYILGLTGQAGGRIGIRFWYRDTVLGLLKKLAKHHHDLAIVRQWEPGPKIRHPDPEFPAIWLLLRQTGRESKDVPPTLAGALMRAILTGSPYPQILITSVISRIRADREINYLRAAIIKGWLVRNHNQHITMTYDSQKPDAAYRLGALFALLEKTQADALGDVNASIRDRYYSSASATPASVFPRLIRTYGHHLSKASSANRGYKTYREKEVQSVLADPAPLTDFPAHLNLRDQGLFAIGYYHKRKDLFTKSEKTTSDGSE